jgi:thiamine-phosphate pyrophosphorylase
MAVIHRKSHRALPTLWLFTDERVSDAVLIEAVARLPRGSGIIFRHTSLSSPKRKALFDRVRLSARRNGNVLMLAGTSRQAQAWRADGWHAKASTRTRLPCLAAKPMLCTRAAHTRRETLAAQKSGADAMFVSPIFATRSHPGAQWLGCVKLGLMLNGVRVPIMALGGITRHRARSLRKLGIAGWGAIDALIPKTT